MRLAACGVCLLVTLGFCLKGAQETSAQNAPEMVSRDSAPTFSSRVDLVLVPVVVRDRTGKAVGNLTKDDFRLFDKNKPQTIARFSVEKSAGSPDAGKTVQSNSPPPEGASAESGKTSRPSDIPERYVAYVFDDLNTSFADLARVQKAAKTHLSEHLQPTDRAAIYTTSGQNMLDFTSDRAKLLDMLMRIHPKPMFGAATRNCPDISYYMADRIINKNDQQAMQTEIQETIVCMSLDSSAAAQAQQMVQATASQVLSISEQGTRISLDVIKGIVRRMSSMPGKRIVVLVSSGFLTLNPDSVEMKAEIMDRAARENVVISSLDARGLYTDPTFDASRQAKMTQQAEILASQYDRESASAQADVLAELADGTDGTFFQNNNDLLAGLDRVAALPEVVYLLAFSPENLKSDGSFHKLKVTLVNERGFEVRARRGYYAPRHGVNAEETAKAEIEDAVFSREEMHELPVDLHTQFFKPDPSDAKLTVLARIDLKHLRFKKTEGRNQNNLTVVSVVFDHDGKYVTGVKKIIDMKLKDETLERLASGITVKSSFDVKPGVYMIRLVVRDTEGQMMAATNGAVDIP